MNLVRRLQSLYQLWLLKRHIRSLPPIQPPHRDDVSLEIAELVYELARALAASRVTFAGDLADDDPMRKEADWHFELVTLIRDTTLLQGRCGGCHGRYPGLYPAPTLREFVLSGWRRWNVGTSRESLICPECMAEATEAMDAREGD